jgi:peptidoglycan/xylan/chitin deacetylase (PgdA/CDA1 family)
MSARSRLSALASAMLRQRFPAALWEGRTAERVVALTYDDGPDERDTLPVLDVLARHGVTATFFQIGERAERLPDLTRAVADAGHQVAIHGYRHRAFPLELSAALRAQLAHTRRLLGEVTGRGEEAIRDVRPPFGVYTPAVLSALCAWGYRPVMWSVVPFHWLQPPAPSIAQATRGARPGSLLVLHESLAGPPVAELSDAIIPRLKAAGFRFISVDAMWGYHRRDVEAATPIE